jgi:methionyl-tRNA formyltransferase
MRILFAGTPLNAAQTLESLLEAGFEIAGVLTRQDAPVGRAKTLTPSPVATLAERNGFPLMRANSVPEEVINWMASLNVELGVIVAYGTILRSNALSIPTKGWVNVHYSLLPKYPGASPVQHAIMNGESKTGVTVFRLDEGVDTGPILAQSELEIDSKMNSADLLAELSGAGSNLLIDTLHNLEDRFANQRFQSVPTGEAVAGKISRSDARLNFAQSAAVVHNFIRAMNPEPVAWFEHSGIQVRVIRASVVDAGTLSVGEAKLDSGQLVVGCSAGAVVLSRVQPAGKTEMSGADWFRGLREESILIS